MGVDVELLVISSENRTTSLDGLRVRSIPKVAEFYRLPLANAIPHLVRTDAEVVHGHSYVFPIVVQAALVSRMRNLRFLLHLHGGVQTSKEYTTAPLALKEHIYDPTIGRMLARISDGIAAVSATDLMAAERILRIPSRIPRFHLPNCVDLQEVDKNLPGIGRRSSNHCQSVVFAGRLVPEKGVHLLPAIDRQLQREWKIRVRWDVAGEGPLAATIKAWAERDPSRISYHGPTRGKEYYSLLADSDLLVLPSLAPEGVPTVCLEAMASRTPVVGFNSGGVSEVVLDGETGFLVQPNDVDTLCQKAARLLSNRALRNQFGARGRQLVEKRFSVEQVARKTLFTYSLLLSR